MNSKALSLLLASLLPMAASAQMFHAQVLPALPGTSQCAPSGMNGSGDVVGSCSNAPSLFDSRAVVWRNGVPSSLGTLQGGTYSVAVAINSLGVIAGDSNTAGNAQPLTFVTTPGGLVNVDPIGGANVDALAITDNGAIFSNINKSGGGRTNGWYIAMLTADPKSPGRYREVAFPKTSGATKYDITFGYAANNLGQVVGQVQVYGQHQTGALWNNDAAHSIVLLPDLMGSNFTDLHGINDLGQITGSASLDFTLTTSHAAIWSGDASHTITDIGTLPGDTNATGFAINNAGQVIGTSTNGAASRPFLYSNGVMQDLSTLIDPLDGPVQIGNLYAINNAGQILADTTVNGLPAVLVLTPIAP